MEIKDLIKMIDESKRIVFFGGAGVSTASGIKDFRSKDGLYSETFLNARPEDILSHQTLMQNPSLFYKYYKEKFLIDMPKPNEAHYFLAKLEAMGKLTAIITQNIDGLHQKAGSKNVIELHGSIFRNYTVFSQKRYDDIQYILDSDDVPYKDGEMLRPDVTLFGEPLNELSVYKAIIALKEADMVIVGGTSLSVYPAASFIHYFEGDKLVGINREKLNIKYFIQGDISSIFKDLLDYYL